METAESALDSWKLLHECSKSDSPEILLQTTQVYKQVSSLHPFQKSDLMMRNRPLVAQLLVVTPRQVRLFLKLGLLQRRGQLCYILPNSHHNPTTARCLPSLCGMPGQQQCLAGRVQLVVGLPMDIIAIFDLFWTFKSVPLPLHHLCFPPPPNMYCLYLKINHCFDPPQGG